MATGILLATVLSALPICYNHALDTTDGIDAHMAKAMVACMDRQGFKPIYHGGDCETGGFYAPECWTKGHLSAADD